MKMMQLRLIIICCLVIFATGAFAQATLKGKLYNKQTKEKLSGATVTLKNNPITLNSVSDNDGEFRFKDIEP